MAILLVLTVVAVTAAILAGRGGTTERVTPRSPAPTETEAGPGEQSGAETARADGCLGGPTELDQAVLAAQKEAPLTEDGAAAFAATVIRWAMTVPAPRYQGETAEKILVRTATASARNLSGTQDAADTTLTPSTVDARYYVESYEPTRAIVTLSAQITGTRGGTPQGQADVSGSLTLVAVNGSWRLEDISDGRSVEDLQRIGTVYAGGC